MESSQSSLVKLIKEWFDYDPIKGVLIRKKKTRSDAFDEVNFHNTIPFAGKHYPYAVLCWVVYYGEFPKGLVDHKDRIRPHNWITNLRIANNYQNGQNSAGTGTYPKGVTWRNRIEKPWQAKIRVNGERLHLGSFASMEEAATAYQEACLKYHGEFACPE